MLGLTFDSKLDWGCYTISIAKTTSKKIGELIRSMKFLSLERLFCISIKNRYVELQTAKTTNYEKRYAELLVV